MATKITLIRHGESTGNAASCYTGQTDVALSPLGLRQAEVTAMALQSERFTAIYASDLQRAYITAQTIAQHHNLDVTQIPQLREINLGAFQGRSFLDVEREYPREFAAITKRELDICAPAGETHREMRTRVVDAFRKIIDQHPNGHVLIVVHGGVIFHINHHIFEIADERYFTLTYKISNCSIHRFELLDDQRWRVIGLNDEAHLTNINEEKKIVTDNKFQRISEQLFGCSQ